VNKDAGGGVHGQVGSSFRNQDRVAILSAAGGGTDVSAGGDDAVERAAVYDEVFNDGESLGAPGLQKDFLAVFEVAHGQLADCGTSQRAVGDSRDHEAAGAADAFAAVVLEGDGLLVF
jgi:hypothetical protein